MNEGLCEHCSLPLGSWPYEGEGHGEVRNFCCYGCFIGWQAAHGGGDEATAAGFLIRLGIGGFLAMNIMLFSLVLYSGTLDAEIVLKQVIHWILWGLATPVLLILGGPFMAETGKDLVRGRLSPSFLIVLGASAAYFYSAIATFAGGDRVYFDTATMVLVLFTLGRFLEAHGRARATRSLRPFLEPECATATVMRDGVKKELPLSEVEAGMMVSIGPGTRILIDGKVCEGISEAGEALMTGEARPVPKQPGVRVLAGTINGDGTLLVEATVAGLDSRWIGICRDLRFALSQPSRAQRIADQAARILVPLVVALAAVTATYHWQMGAADALMAGLAVLVVACPCALGLAAPLATSIVIGDLARRGILVRSAGALETLGRIGKVALDKTGTLTAGHPRCVSVVGDDIAEERLLIAAASVSTGSHHPLAHAVVEAAEDHGMTIQPARDIETVPGMGVRGLHEGRPVFLGNRRWLRELGIAMPQMLETSAEALATEGRMLSFVAWGDKARGVFAFEDPIHSEAAPLLSWLAQVGIKTTVLSGDGKQQTERLCRSLGIESWSAELSPEEKRQALDQHASERRPVAMVGDGLNDAPAMTASAVGIAVGRSADLARETADAVLPRGGLGLLPQLITMAQKSKAAISTNLAWAFGYNAIALALAASGSLQPVVAAALMAGSSLFVVGNSIVRLTPDKDIPTSLAKKANAQRNVKAPTIEAMSRRAL